MVVRLDVNFDRAGASRAEIERLMWSLRKLQREALLRIGEVIVPRAKRRVPVVSGLLRDSIAAKVRKWSGEDALRLTISTNTRNKIKYLKSGRIYRRRKDGTLVLVSKGESMGTRDRKVVSRYGYGADVEIGRPSGNYKSTPYLRPAVAESVGDIRRIYREEADREASARGRR